MLGETLHCDGKTSHCTQNPVGGQIFTGALKVSQDFAFDWNFSAVWKCFVKIKLFFCDQKSRI